MHKSPPASVCTRCGKYGTERTLDMQCSAVVDGKRCQGHQASAVGAADWMLCKVCAGLGCDACQRSGWLFQRQR